jgi:alpha-N-arabinofuranosidase
MPSSSRRDFLKLTGTAALGSIAGPAFGRTLFAGQSPNMSSAATKIYIDVRREIGAIDRNLFGSFLEHLGRAIYDGIYDPGSKLSDENGFRKDVLAEVRELQVPIIRYPGGNFVSGYNWLDGIGPRKDRPAVLDKAWDSLNSNQFGTDEFMAWCRLAGTKPLMGLNLGTGTPEQAAALVEYCNVASGTRWSDLRRKNGVADPYNAKYWCLGNEMDGPWQIGHITANEYGLRAADAARQMRDVDRTLKLVACGSSGPGMPTYLEWDREVLEQCYEYVDGLSLHRYFTNTPEETGGDSAKFLALNLTMDKQIEETLAVCDMVRGKKRSPKQLWLSFDEWNVWYRARDAEAMDGHAHEKPHLLEEIYNLEDALLVGGLINTLVRHAGRIKIACLAQLVNVIAPIMTNANGLYRQTIYYPYSWGLHFARGSALDVLVEAPSTYDVSGMGAVPHLDVMATMDSGSGKIAVFVLNRDLKNPRQAELTWESGAPGKFESAWVITGDDLKAVNGFDAPDRVKPVAAVAPTTSGGITKMEVPPRSYSIFQWSVS